MQWARLSWLLATKMAKSKAHEEGKTVFLSQFRYADACHKCITGKHKAKLIFNKLTSFIIPIPLFFWRGGTF